MIFNSFTYIIFFLPLALILYYAAPINLRKLILLVLSTLFFTFARPLYLPIILASILINYLLTQLMDKREDKRIRHLIFLFLVLINISVLFTFKYLNFTLGNINGILGTNFYADNLIAPLGISFYTFQVLSYVTDVYRKNIGAGSVLDLMLYLLMFPQLTSGPIMKYSEIEAQGNEVNFNVTNLGEGLERFIFGFFKKTVLADSLLKVWIEVKNMRGIEISLLTAWVGIIAFTLYIYFDFSGYMDMAIGTAKAFGYELKENFRYPYRSLSISEFWRRWHITLGRWFRDYVYIPLGGSRNGILKTILSIIAVWFLTGLWHGGTWNFIVWGLYFGIIVLIEKLLLKDSFEGVPKFLRNAGTMILVIIGWVIFDTKTLGEAFSYIGYMLGGNLKFFDKVGFFLIANNLFYFILGFLLTGPWIRNIFLKIKKTRSNSYRIGALVMTLLVFVISLIFLVNQGYSPSLYQGF